MPLIGTEIKDEILILKLKAGVTNPINLELIQELLVELDKTTENEGIEGLVLTSNNNKFFSIGFDIPKLLDLDKTGVRAFLMAFNELCLNLATLPIPTISAITGHYVAAGAILAACTDYRFITDGKGKTGITAVKLGLPVPILAEKILRLRINESYADELLTTGELYDTTWALNAGFIDGIKPKDTLIDDAFMFLKENLKKEKKNIIKRKQQIAIPLRQGYFENKERDTEKFIDRWFSKPVQEALREATKKY